MMASAPLISVVIPTRNRAELLAATLESLSSQSLRAWEAVVVDDGSSPDQLAAVERLAAADRRVVLLQRRGDPPGGNRCRNIGASAARAPLLVFLDDDDVLGPSALEVRVSAMTAHPELDFAVFPDAQFVRVPGDLPRAPPPLRERDPIDAYLRMMPPWHTGGPVWRRSALERVGPWHEGIQSWQDWEFGLRALCLGPKYRIIDDLHYFYRVASEGRETIASRGWHPRHVRSWPVAMDAVMRRLEGAGLLTRRRKMLLARLGLFVAVRLAEIGDAVESRAFWGRLRSAGIVGPAVAATGSALMNAARLEPLRPRVRRTVFMLMTPELAFPRVAALLRRARADGEPVRHP